MYIADFKTFKIGLLQIMLMCSLPLL